MAYLHHVHEHDSTDFGTVPTVMAQTLWHATRQSAARARAHHVAQDVRCRACALHHPWRMVAHRCMRSVAVQSDVSSHYHRHKASLQLHRQSLLREPLRCGRALRGTHPSHDEQKRKAQPQGGAQHRFEVAPKLDYYPSDPW